jgi:DNA-binding GntR family transcriptional regulator
MASEVVSAVHDGNKNLLIKDRLAAILREEIVSGRVQPGEPIVEGHWASKLGVAHASIREALNILTGEGFVEKGSGQSAKVTKLSMDDVIQLYDVRAALEGVAARLVAEKRPDLRGLDQAVADMSAAVACQNVMAYYERDLQFHLLIARKSGNRFLMQQIRWLLAPLFAFYVMRVHVDHPNPSWGYSLEEHRRIVEVLRTAEPAAAQIHMEATVRKFFEQTHHHSSAGLTGNAENTVPLVQSLAMRSPGAMER